MFQPTEHRLGKKDIIFTTQDPWHNAEPIIGALEIFINWLVMGKLAQDRIRRKYEKNLVNKFSVITSSWGLKSKDIVQQGFVGFTICGPSLMENIIGIFP